MLLLTAGILLKRPLKQRQKVSVYTAVPEFTRKRLYDHDFRLGFAAGRDAAGFRHARIL